MISEDDVFVYFKDLKEKMTNLTPENVISVLAYNIAKNGTGIMTGAGFSKAVLENGEAKNWLELFAELIQRINDVHPNQFDDNYLVNKLNNAETLPKIGSDICKKVAISENIDLKNAEKEVKKIVSALVSWNPDEKEIEVYRKLFQGLSVNWCVTMNYDDVLEAIFGENGFPINPSQPIIAPMGKIPIYHIHGSKHDPEHLILTYDDYVKLFQPGNYREAKLSTLLAERSVIVMGYSVSDVNIAASMTQKNNFFENDNFVDKEFIVNLEYDPTHIDETFEPTIDENKVLYNIRVKDISNFLEYLNEKVQKCRDMMENAKKLESKFVDNCEKVIRAIDEIRAKSKKNYRDISTFLEYGNFSGNLLQEDQKTFLNNFCNNPSSQILYINQLFDELNGIHTSDKFNKFLRYLIYYEKGKSHARNNFNEYNKLLIFLIDVLESNIYSLLSPSNVELVMDTLNYTFSKSGLQKSKSKAAENTWREKGKGLFKKHKEIWDEIYIQAQFNKKNKFIIQKFDWIKCQIKSEINA